jgi:lauroyl/myristoyl acyltransferase
MSDESRPEDGRWRRHGMNTGTIFGLTRWGVSRMPKAVSYAIGHVSTWLAFHLMKAETAALIDNFRVMLPRLGERELRALALCTYRTYAREVAVQAAMQAFAIALEGIVRQYPHLWYNFYPFWDTADPDGER